MRHYAKLLCSIFLALLMLAAIGAAPAETSDDYNNGIAAQRLLESDFVASGLAAYNNGDYATAYRFFRLGADSGVAKAQYNLGVLYHSGAPGIPQNYSEALKWFRLAADQGLAPAQYNLGIMHEEGNGVPQNYTEALKWFRLAADQGYANAEGSLGEMYAGGYGVPVNHTEALKWFRRAADKGYANAQYNLGIMYEGGYGVVKSYVQAHMWFSLAAASQFPNALMRRDVVSAKMTQVQIAEAQKLAREYGPHQVVQSQTTTNPQDAAATSTDQWDQFPLASQSRKLLDKFDAWINDPVVWGSIFGGVVFLGLYFLPLIIAVKRHHRQTLAIGMLNVFFLLIPIVGSMDADNGHLYAFGVCAVFIWLGLLTWACIKRTPKYENLAKLE